MSSEIVPRFLPPFSTKSIICSPTFSITLQGAGSQLSSNQESYLYRLPTAIARCWRLSCSVDSKESVLEREKLLQVAYNMVGGLQCVFPFILLFRLTLQIFRLKGIVSMPSLDYAASQFPPTPAAKHSCDAYKSLTPVLCSCLSLCR